MVSRASFGFFKLWASWDIFGRRLASTEAKNQEAKKSLTEAKRDTIGRRPAHLSFQERPLGPNIALGSWKPLTYSRNRVLALREYVDQPLGLVMASKRDVPSASLRRACFFFFMG
jgi:hypothetical protein